MGLEATYAGLKVLDLATNLAGPFAAMILGDLGADVVKVERSPGGDDTRSLPPRHGDQATVFLAVNRNKRSLLLDYKSDEGKAALLRLMARADVVVESFPPGWSFAASLLSAMDHEVDSFRATTPWSRPSRE
jgi:crotonobetainyl-CoA:carnitine CoA-transferase CaiB-like acyl-CoA transferase